MAGGNMNDNYSKATKSNGTETCADCVVLAADLREAAFGGTWDDVQAATYAMWTHRKRHREVA